MDERPDHPDTMVLYMLADETVLYYVRHVYEEQKDVICFSAYPAEARQYSRRSDASKRVAYLRKMFGVNLGVATLSDALVERFDD